MTSDPDKVKLITLSVCWWQQDDSTPITSQWPIGNSPGNNTHIDWFLSLADLQFVCRVWQQWDLFGRESSIHSLHSMRDDKFTSLNDIYNGEIQSSSWVNNDELSSSKLKTVEDSPKKSSLFVPIESKSERVCCSSRPQAPFVESSKYI